MENNNSSFDKVLVFLKKHWSIIASIGGSTFLGFFMFFAVLILVVILFSAGAGIIGSVQEFFVSVSEGSQVFYEKVGNLFTLKGFHTDEEAARLKEYEYYEELNRIQEKYLEKYGVFIDTTLITATLTYNRNLGDYTKAPSTNLDIVNPGSGNTYIDSGMSDDDIADFYVAAKGHIKTLAEYMLLATRTTSSCGQNITLAQTTYTPTSIEEVAAREVLGFSAIVDLRNAFAGNGANFYLGYNLRKIEVKAPYLTYDKTEIKSGIKDENGNDILLPACYYEDVTPNMNKAWGIFLNKYNTMIENDEVLQDEIMKYNNCLVEEQLGTVVAGTCNKDDILPLLDNYLQMMLDEQNELITKGFFVPRVDAISFRLSDDGFNCVQPFFNSSSANVIATENNAKGLKKYDGCALLPYDSLSYSVSAHEGTVDTPSLYQANLKIPIKKIFNFSMSKETNFIQEYDKDWVYDESGEEIPGKVDEIIDGIYDLYKFVKGSSITSLADGEWNNWSQKDPLWKDVAMGPGSATIGSVGCLITSYAIQIMNSGTPVTIPDFNPGTFVQSLGVTAFGDGGDFVRGDGVGMFNPAAPYFTCTRLNNVSSSVLATYLDDNKWPIVQVYNPSGRGRTHFVAVIGYEKVGDQIRPIMADPATNKTDLFATYPEIAHVIGHLKICESTR